jgi:hypothetical protein
MIMSLQLDLAPLTLELDLKFLEIEISK